MKKLLSFLSIAYLIYALLVAWFVGRTLLQVYRAYSVATMAAAGVSWLPLVAFLIISLGFISMFVCLAFFLSTGRRCRAALIIAAISCIGIPVGTILGGLTIYALTRPEIASEFDSGS